MKPKAVVAMSGGVDSSVAAALMKEDGYEVTGIMMKLWSGEAANNESGCCSLDAAEDARRVAQMLDIPFYVFNFAERFNKTVVQNFITQYSNGRTPNPCVECNRSIKFATLLERTKAIGAEVLATGHYARVTKGETASKLLRGADPAKDQSYVLYVLGQTELAAAHFPVGNYSKPEIRSIAASLDLRTAAKPESQEICFVPNGDSHSFIQDSIPRGSVPGPILTMAGERIGTHRGYSHYTVGQRRGLGVGRGFPIYVREVISSNNAIVVATKDEMTCDQVELEGVTFVEGEPPLEPRVSVMTRYRGPEATGFIGRVAGRWTVRFDESQTMPAPGQAAVFYRGDELIGGGIIARVA